MGVAINSSSGGNPMSKTQEIASPPANGRMGDGNSLKRARQLFGAGDFEAAARQFLQVASELKDTDPDDMREQVKMLTNASLAFFSAGNFQESLSAAETSLTRLPNWEKGHYRRGEALMGLKKYDQAVSAFREAMECQQTETSQEDAAHVQQRLDDAQGAAEILLQIQSSENEVAEMLKEKQPERSLEEIQKERRETDTAPESAAALKVGAAHMQNGNVEAALKSFRDAVAEDPMNYQAHLQFGLICLAVGKIHEGTRSLRECIRQEPGCLTAYTACAEAYATLGLPDASVEMYAKLLGTGGAAAQGWSGLAGAFYSQGKVSEAAKVLAEAKSIESDPQKGINVSGDPLVSVMEAFILAVRGRAAESAAAFMKHFEEAPLFQPLLRLAAAQIYTRAGEGAAAAERCTGVLEASWVQLPLAVKLRTASWINNHLDSPAWTSVADLKIHSSFISSLRMKKEQASQHAATGQMFQLPQDHALYLSWHAATKTALVDTDDSEYKLLALPLAVKGMPQLAAGKEQKQLVQADHFLGKEFSSDDYGPILLMPVVPSGCYMGSSPLLKIVSVRFFMVVVQSHPVVAYWCACGVASVIGDDKHSMQETSAPEDCTIALEPPASSSLSLSSRLICTADAAQDSDDGSCVSNGLSLGQPILEAVGNEMGRVVADLEVVLQEKRGSFRPNNHDKLLLPKIVSLDMTIDAAGDLTLTRLCPYPDLAAVEASPLQTAAFTAVMDAWRLVLEAAKAGTEANGPRWPGKFRSLERIISSR